MLRYWKPDCVANEQKDAKNEQAAQRLRYSLTSKIAKMLSAKYQY